MSDTRWNKLSAITAITAIIFACITFYVTVIAGRSAEATVDPLTLRVNSNTIAVAVLETRLSAIDKQLKANNVLIGQLIRRLPPEVYWLRDDDSPN